jgi:hypothetical protein
VWSGISGTTVQKETGQLTSQQWVLLEMFGLGFLFMATFSEGYKHIATDKISTN